VLGIHVSAGYEGLLDDGEVLKRLLKKTAKAKEMVIY
jgi:hypothetical protein